MAPPAAAAAPAAAPAPKVPAAGAAIEDADLQRRLLLILNGASAAGEPLGSQIRAAVEEVQAAGAVVDTRVTFQAGDVEAFVCEALAVEGWHARGICGAFVNEGCTQSTAFPSPSRPPIPGQKAPRTQCP